MLLLFAMAGFAVDVGHVYVVKGQLQNAADASALAGAASLYDLTKTPPNLTWKKATDAAKAFVGKNSADGKPLTDSDVQGVYWDLKNKATVAVASVTKTGLCQAASATTCNSDSECPKGDVCMPAFTPAVQVALAKSGSNGNGAVAAAFTKVVGWNQFEPGATGVALSGFPGSFPAGWAFPFGVAECMKEDFIKGTGIFAGHDPISDPVAITFTNKYTTSDGSTTNAGLWTDLLQTNTSDKTVQDYISNLTDGSGKQPPGVYTGETINLTNGTNNKLYQLTADLITAGKGMVYMPVVQCPLDDVGTRNMQIKGFAKIQLTASDNPKSTIIGHFIGFIDQAPAGTGPGGVPSNIVIPPMMVQ
jgi:Flp pilus assembly protein TadG